MKIFNIAQTKGLDDYTILHEPISSEALMIRAATRFTDRLLQEILPGKKIFVFAGPGNNGGDARLIARYLSEKKYPVTVFEDINEDFVFPDIHENDYVVDGLFGAGINRPLNGIYADLVQHINRSKARVYSIDIPSGLFGEDNTGNNPDTIIKAYKTFTFQYPKLAFFFAENEVYTGEWEIIDIGLHPEVLNRTDSPFYFMEKKEIKNLLKKRHKFDHKGVFGHALIIAGSKGKFGAAVLASQACLRSGAGLVTAHVPSDAEVIMQTAVPEAMVDLDKNPKYVSNIILSSAYSALGIGPGLSANEITEGFLFELLKENDDPCVLDADALNLISQTKTLMNLVPPGAVLTPHPKEFDRLAGSSLSSSDRLQKARKMAVNNRIYIVLKGTYTAICTPDNTVYFNSTGNPGMATAGSGDVLTGIITGLLAQSYTPEEACRIGVFLHGLAGDIAAKKHSQESMIAGDIIECLGQAFLKRCDPHDS